jgi:hypothetical protein
MMSDVGCRISDFLILGFWDFGILGFALGRALSSLYAIGFALHA